VFIGDPENAVSSPRVLKVTRCSGLTLCSTLYVVISAGRGTIDRDNTLVCNETHCFLFQNEEFITLADPKLSLFTGEEEDVDMMDVNDIPQHKITDFT